MSRGRLRRLQVRLRHAGSTWWAAVSGGRFFSAWSAVVAVLVAVTVLAPFGAARTVPQVLAAQSAALAVIGVLIAAALPAVRAERRLTSPAARGTLVVSVLVAVSVVRPILNDIAVGAFGLEPASGRPERIVTNLIVWVALLSLVAVSEHRYASSRAATRRLAEALNALTGEQRRVVRFERENHDFLRREVAGVRAALASLLGAALDFDRVRVFSEEVRAASHRVQDRSRIDLADVPPEDAVAVTSDTTHRTVLERLRPPPMLFIGPLFLLGTLPFALRTGGLALMAAAVTAVLGVAWCADLATRRVGRRLGARTRGAIFVAVWAAAGIVLTAIAVIVVGEAGLVAYIPLVAMPGLAVAAAICTDAIHRSGVEARRLSRVLRDVALTTARRATRAREPLRRGADILHGRVQGGCVILAARLDEEIATDDDVAAFRGAVDRALDEVLGAAAVDGEGALDLAQTMAVWSRVLAVEAEVDEAATEALRDPAVSLRVAAIVAEGLVNAVKHATARVARIEVVAPSCDRLIVRVITPGSLRSGFEMGGGRGIAGLGPSASLQERGDDVVLEAVVATVGEPGSAASGAAG